MRRKQKYQPVSDLDAIEIVTQYHLGRATQTELALRFGISSAHACRLCHGSARPEIYALVKMQLAKMQSTKADA